MANVPKPDDDELVAAENVVEQGGALLARARAFPEPQVADLGVVEDRDRDVWIPEVRVGEPARHVLPDDARAVIDGAAWPRPPVFDWLQRMGKVEAHEMHRTFNCGIGMTVVVPPQDAERTIALLRQAGEQAWRIGAIESRGPDQPYVTIR